VGDHHRYLTAVHASDIATQRETLLHVILVNETQCLRYKRFIKDNYGVEMPALPPSFNAELKQGTWDLKREHVTCEGDFYGHNYEALEASKAVMKARKLQLTQQQRHEQLALAREKYTACISGQETGKFVSIDIECFERDQKRITEIGISALRFPGGRIHTEHLLVWEHRHMRNGRWVPDNSRAFNHGKSRWINLRDCETRVLDALKGRFSEQVYLIGHDPLADIRFLEKNLGCSVPAGLITFDTRLMFSAWGGDHTLRKLSICLEEVGVQYSNLHNAGNPFF
jgi:hypothetical protein